MRHAPPTAAASALRDEVRNASTCKLTVGAGAAQIALYLLDGQLIGAKARDDVPQLIDRLSRQAELSASRARQLRAMASNASAFLGSASHDPILGLLTEEVAPTVMEPLLLERFEENVARFVGHTGAPTVTPEAPWTENLQMGHDTPELIDLAAERHAMATALEDDLPLAVGSHPAATELERTAQQLVSDRQATTVIELANALDLDPLAARAALGEMLQAQVLTSKRRSGVSSPASSSTASSKAPRRTRSILAEDEFEPVADGGRGSLSEGGFTTRRQNLDRVEIDPSVLSSHPDPSEPQARFSAPSLSDDDAMAKIDVANDVLGATAAALDAHLGEGQGRSTLQILVDGRPRPFMPLFDGLRVTPGGALPGTSVLRNLRKRPVAEQRRLLKQGLLDLLDRTLDKAADSLPDEALDDLIGQTVGFRQRMGL